MTLKTRMAHENRCALKSLETANQFILSYLQQFFVQHAPALGINNKLKETDLVENNCFFTIPVTVKKRTNQKLFFMRLFIYRREFLFYLMMQQIIAQLKEARLEELESYSKATLEKFRTPLAEAYQLALQEETKIMARFHEYAYLLAQCGLFHTLTEEKLQETSIEMDYNFDPASCIDC